MLEIRRPQQHAHATNVVRRLRRCNIAYSYVVPGAHTGLGSQLWALSQHPQPTSERTTSSTSVHITRSFDGGPAIGM
eukprot:m.1153586 g.1153586  ORF g.1153586 m.1153586 type:complete len:77 (-) comp24487_c0_seq1:3978-4208(-)